MSTAAEDRELIAASVGDPVHFAVVFDRHFDPVHRFVDRRLGSDAADTLAGEVFRIAFERRDRYDMARPSCLPWLYGIAHKLVLKEYRRRGRHLRAVGRLRAEVASPDVTGEIDARVDAHAAWPGIAAALAQLSEVERDVLLLVAWEGPTMNEDLDILRVVRPSVDGPDRALVERERNALMAIIESSTEQTEADRQRRRRRVTWMVPAAVAVVAATAAAGWAVLRSEPARDTAAFSCVADDFDAGLPNDGTDPIEACKRLWEESGGQAPPLVGCVSSYGGVVVIEGADEQACEQAGMSSWAGGDDFTAVGDAVRAVRVGFHDRADATGNVCATEADWREQLGAAFAERDLGEWTFDINQVEPDRHCYDLGKISPGERRIELVGVPGEDSIGCDPRTGC